MLTFLKNCALKNINTKLFILYLLNVTDIFFTFLLLNTGYFIEANIFMVKLTQNPLLGILVKVLLPGILLLYIYKRIKKASDTQLKISNTFLNIITIFYATINIFHIIFLTFTALV